MNPQDFWWNEDQQVTVTNPTSEDYNFHVHSKAYQLRAGKTAKMPGYIAWVYVYGMASKLAQADGQFSRWNEEGFRKDYYEKVVSGVDATIQAVEDVPDPAVTTFDEVDTTTAPAEPEAPNEPENPAPVEPSDPEPELQTSGAVDPNIQSMEQKASAAKAQRGRSAKV